jgi:protoheme IX farnesyltransferase
MWYERDIDALMERTRNRPLPAGLIAPSNALGFGIVLAAASVMLMALATNLVAATLLAMTIGFYVFIYTIWLKRRTPQNIVIGGAAGAFPPMVGWAAATGSLSFEPVLLFLIIFFWTPPHFWALSLYRAEDYARAGIPMLPVVKGDPATRRSILRYTLILAPLGLAPWFAGYAGMLYGLTALVSGALMLVLAWQVFCERRPAERASRHLFAFSILYLFLLYAVLLIERGWGGLIGRLLA